MAKVLRVILPIIVLIAGWFAWSYLSEEPNQKKGKAAKVAGEKKGGPRGAPGGGSKGGRGKRSINATVVPLERQDYQIHLRTQGEVRATYDVDLSAEVGGKILHIAPNFADGAFFKRGDVLVELDPADYRTNAERAIANLARAQTALQQEEARGEQALLNWQDSGFDGEPGELVLRKPQLREAMASVKAAEADLERAQRDLQRTKVRAPFDGRVKQRLIGIGQSVSGNTVLGEIFSTETAEVRVPLSLDQLKHFEIPGEGGVPINSARVKLTDAINTDAGNEWSGYVIRAEGRLNERTRELFVIIRVDDPFGLKSGHAPLRIGQPVVAAIEANVLQGVYQIPRTSLTGVDEIIVIRDERIKRTKFSPIWTDRDSLLVTDGFDAGDYLCITRLRYAPEGAKVTMRMHEEILNGESNTEQAKVSSKASN
ncbi:efflux RND transporter periplasmic adaptor subunit [Persicirhabdus sediminis]|uniref:Efflux RND transporter periplasmic adaptor subunit n=1 Tax=Persicirhabdus sediminis TaxID=454144 RepID=A0A8J7MF28_9BACT|nr:efflux RND transporter periplasmic adaptor subunit [Persicirhabdus sediminis]MBK1792201.1 efflux RND transporter periplasmic adaptor subunit [Persicirhabdus sediminis]